MNIFRALRIVAAVVFARKCKVCGRKSGGNPQCKECLCFIITVVERWQQK